MLKKSTKTIVDLDNKIMEKKINSDIRHNMKK